MIFWGNFQFLILGYSLHLHYCRNTNFQFLILGYVKAKVRELTERERNDKETDVPCYCECSSKA